ncbi:MAG: hypothetical protein ACUVX9_06190 [Anaerolineae bacterium]
MDARYLDLVKGALTLTASTVIARALGFMYPVVAAALLAAADYGVVRYAISLATLVAAPVTATSTVIARTVARSRVSTSSSDSYVASSVAGAAALTAVVLTALMVYQSVFSDLPPGMLAIVVGLAGFYVYSGLVRGLSDIGKLAVLPCASNAFQLLLLGLIPARILPPSPAVVAAVYGMSYIGPIVALEAVHPLAHIQLRMISGRVLGELGRLYMPLALAHAAYTAWMSIDVICLGLIRGSSQVASYSVGKTVTTVLEFVPTAVTTLLLPRLARGGPSAEARFSACLLILTSVPLAIGIAVGSPLVVRVLFGGKYAVSPVVVAAQAVGMALHGLYTVQEVRWVAAGKTHLHLLAIGVALLMNIVGQVTLTPRFGMLGSAFSFALSIALAPAPVIVLEKVGVSCRALAGKDND